MSADFANLLGADVDWLAELRPYQRNSINKLLADRSPQDAIEAWFNSFKGVDNTVKLGAGDRISPYYDRFLDQVYDLFCSETRYVDERVKIVQEVHAGKVTVTTAISAAVAPHLGSSATVILPAVALFLMVVGKMTLKSICEEQAARGRGTENKSTGDSDSETGTGTGDPD